MNTGDYLKSKMSDDGSGQYRLGVVEGVYPSGQFEKASVRWEKNETFEEETIDIFSDWLVIVPGAEVELHKAEIAKRIEAKKFAEDNNPLFDLVNQ